MITSRHTHQSCCIRIHQVFQRTQTRRTASATSDKGAGNAGRSCSDSKIDGDEANDRIIVGTSLIMIFDGTAKPIPENSPVARIKGCILSSVFLQYKRIFRG